MIKIRTTKAIREQRRAPLLSSLARASWLAGGFAEHVLRRVGRSGQIYRDNGPRMHFRFSGPPPRGRPYFVAPSYAAEATGSAETDWRSSAAFHRAAGARAGAFNVSGGMWKGLSVAGGKGVARVQFGGSSEGNSSKLQAKEKIRRRKGVVVSRATVMVAKKVRNRVKARKILESSGVNILAIPRPEREAMGWAVASALRVQFQSATGEKFSRLRYSGRARGLAIRIKRRMRGIR